MRASSRRAFELLRKKLDDLPEAFRAEAEEVLAAEKQILAQERRLLEQRSAAHKIRIHGDFHLGQALHTGRDFIFLDFEGEPARPLGERKLKRSALRDVAGMMRSFQYAAYSALWQPAMRQEDVPFLEKWADLWYREMSSTFLQSYLAATPDDLFIPRNEADLRIALEDYVQELVGEFGENVPLFPSDVSSDEEITKFFQEVRGQTDRLDLLLHSVAFAPKEALEGDFVSTTREAFRTAHDISAYSLVALAREAAPLMTNGGSIVAMTYYGAEKVVPHYNVMGVAKASLEASTRYLAYDLGPKKIRVNCISAGPVNTLAARGISGFSSMLKHYQERAPLKRSCEPAELGATGVFLASDGAAGITGQVIYVDGGYQIMGM